MNTTQTAQHTPGPWKFYRDERYIESENANLRGDYDHVCDFRTDLAGNVNEANARLIAAAPDLLAALQAIHAGFMDGSIKWAKKRQADSDPYHPANTAMSIALAKVRGE